MMYENLYVRKTWFYRKPIARGRERGEATGEVIGLRAAENCVYIYICVCVCVCVCMYREMCFSRFSRVGIISFGCGCGCVIKGGRYIGTVRLIGEYIIDISIFFSLKHTGIGCLQYEVLKDENSM